MTGTNFKFRHYLYFIFLILQISCSITCLDYWTYLNYIHIYIYTYNILYVYMNIDSILENFYLGVEKGVNNNNIEIIYAVLLLRWMKNWISSPYGRDGFSLFSVCVWCRAFLTFIILHYHDYVNERGFDFEVTADDDDDDDVYYCTLVKWHIDVEFILLFKMSLKY